MDVESYETDDEDLEAQTIPEYMSSFRDEWDVVGHDGYWDMPPSISGDLLIREMNKGGHYKRYWDDELDARNRMRELRDRASQLIGDDLETERRQTIGENPHAFREYGALPAGFYPAMSTELYDAHQVKRDNERETLRAGFINLKREREQASRRIEQRRRMDDRNGVA